MHEWRDPLDFPRPSRLKTIGQCAFMVHGVACPFRLPATQRHPDMSGWEGQRAGTASKLALSRISKQALKTGA